MHTYSSDAEWYFTHSEHDDSKQYYDIFFSMCRKYGIRWASATEKERYFIEAVTNHAFSVWKAKQEGKSLDTVPEVFLTRSAS